MNPNPIARDLVLKLDKYLLPWPLSTSLYSCM